MARTLMGEFEALQSRCEHLAKSREARADEAEKATKRLQEVRRITENSFSANSGLHVKNFTSGNRGSIPWPHRHHTLNRNRP